MDVEKIGGIYDYRFNWAEFVVSYGALKFLDSERRKGQSSDTIQINSSIRPLFSEDASDGDDEQSVRWIYDLDKTVIGNYREPAPSPSLDTLLDLSAHVIDVYDVPSLRTLLQAPIGHMVLERPLDRPACSITRFHDQSLLELENKVRVYHTVLSAWHGHLSNRNA